MFKKQDVCGYLKGSLYRLFAHRVHWFRDAPYAYEHQVKRRWTILSLTLDFLSPLIFVHLPDCSFIKRHSLYFFQKISLNNLYFLPNSYQIIFSFRREFQV
jgi:hypothetical protein